MTNRIISSYKQKGDTYLGMVAIRVVAKIEGNPNFANPPEALANAKKLVFEFQTAFTNAGGRDREKSAIKNNVRADLIKALDDLAAYVTQVSKEDKAILCSSGFDVSGKRPAVELGAINQLVVNAERANEAITSIKRVGGARAYVHQYAFEPVTNESSWTSKFVTDNSYTFTGLQSEKRYVFRVIAIGANGQEQYSPLVSKVIQ